MEFPQVKKLTVDVVAENSLDGEEKSEIRNGKKPIRWYRKHAITVGTKFPGRNTKCLFHNIIAVEASMCVVEREMKVAKTDD